MKRIISKTRLVIAIVLVAAVLALAVIGSPWRTYAAIRLLLDLSTLATPVSERRTPPMMRAPVTYEVEDRAYRGDVYRPLEEPLAGLILLHGAAPTGKDDPRLVDFAATFARARFVVLVPDLVRLRKLQLRTGATQEIVDTVLHMVSSPSLAPNGNVGIVTLSVAGGPAVMAALQPEIRERLGFILAIGAYYDLLTTLTYSTTGYFRDDTQWYHREPNDYGKWVLVLSNVEALADRSDRQILATMARRKLANQEAELDGLAARLSPEGRTLYQFIGNTDPAQARRLFAHLPANIKSEIEALSPSKKDLSAMLAQVILVHGLDDPIIPYAESIALADALPPDKVNLFLVNGLFHVDLKPTLKDYWRLWRAIYALLTQRDR